MSTLRKSKYKINKQNQMLYNYKIFNKKNTIVSNNSKIMIKIQ